MMDQINEMMKVFKNIESGDYDSPDARDSAYEMEIAAMSPNILCHITMQDSDVRKCMIDYTKTVIKNALKESSEKETAEAEAKQAEAEAKQAEAEAKQAEAEAKQFDADMKRAMADSISFESIFVPNEVTSIAWGDMDVESLSDIDTTSFKNVLCSGEFPPLHIKHDSESKYANGKSTKGKSTKGKSAKLANGRVMVECKRSKIDVGSTLTTRDETFDKSKKVTCWVSLFDLFEMASYQFLRAVDDHGIPIGWFSSRGNKLYGESMWANDTETVWMAPISPKSAKSWHQHRVSNGVWEHRVKSQTGWKEVSYPTFYKMAWEARPKTQL